MARRPVLKIEPNTYPMPGRERWSLTVFAHSVGSMLDIASAGSALCASFADDDGSVSFYRDDAGQFRGHLHVYGSTRAECKVAYASQAESWLVEAMAFCSRVGAMPPDFEASEDDYWASLSATEAPVNPGGEVSKVEEA